MGGKSFRSSDQKVWFSCPFANTWSLPGKKPKNYIKKKKKREMLYHFRLCLFLSVCPYQPKLHAVVSSRCAPAQYTYKYICTVHTSNTHTHIHIFMLMHRQMYINCICTPNKYLTTLIHVCEVLYRANLRAHASSGSKDTLQEGWQ